MAQVMDMGLYPCHGSCGKHKRDVLFAILCWTQRVSEFRFLNWPYRSALKFMKEEASQLYTTVVIRHSAYLTAYLTAYFCVNLQNLMMSMLSYVINVISHLAPGTCQAGGISAFQGLSQGQRMTRGQRRDLTGPPRGKASAAAQQRYVL